MLNRFGSENYLGTLHTRPPAQVPTPAREAAELRDRLALVTGQRDEAYRALRECLPIVASAASLAATGVTLGVRRILDAR